jgi:hypothetical protein
VHVDDPLDAGGDRLGALPLEARVDGTRQGGLDEQGFCKCGAASIREGCFDANGARPPRVMLMIPRPPAKFPAASPDAAAT